MNQSNETFNIKAIRVLPHLIGMHLDYSLGEEAPLFSPSGGTGGICGVGYNSWKRRKALGMPYFRVGAGTPYKRWVNMMERCYRDEKSAYDDCTVCPKWHDYQEFAAWFAAQPYAGAKDAELDKDILDPLNKMYSPEFCSVVPKVINQVFRDTRSRRGALPIGVSAASGGNGVVSVLSMFGKRVELGTFRDITEAFKTYQAAHRKYCNELVDLYESQVDVRVIERLRTYSRHIRD
jgi:hypothetical protein